MLNPGRYFFEIPIYRLSPAQHQAETERLKARSLAHIENQKTDNPENYAFASRCFDSHSAYSWDFNEIIGYLRLHPLGTQIRGELWFMEAKRIHRGTKKNLRWVGKAFELSVSLAESNETIGRRVLDRVTAVEREAPCKGRYIDVQCLRNAAVALDWRTLLGL